MTSTGGHGLVFWRRITRVVFAAASIQAGAVAEPSGLSPVALAASPDGRTMYIACATGRQIAVFDAAARQFLNPIALPERPTGICIAPDGRGLFVTCGGTDGGVFKVDIGTGNVRRSFRCVSPMAPVVTPDGRRLFACERFAGNIIVFDLDAGQVIGRIPVAREPVAASITPDGRRLLVANHLQRARADGAHAAALIGVIDVGTLKMVDELWLPNGSALVNDVRVSPDGAHAVATHVLARFWRHATKVDGGWLAANAITVINLQGTKVIGTVLLDGPGRGAANPWGVSWSDDGRTLAVAHSGTHELSIIHFPGLRMKMESLEPSAAHGVNSYGALSGAPSDATEDLSFVEPFRSRVRLAGCDLGPRGVAIVGQRVYAANYFSDTLSVIDLAMPSAVAESVPLGERMGITGERLGEMYFNDGRLCREGWLSCATCHPGDARVDALNWDLPNDGLGNAKNTKSLLFAHITPPVMSLGQRDTAESAVRVGIRKILFTEQPPAVAEAIDAYLKSLRSVISPHRVGRALSEAANRGRVIFENDETGCARCHPSPLFTDRSSHEVGTGGPNDRATDAFDTPALLELWRTGPYLHDGSTVDLRDLFVFRNGADKHGKTSHLTADQISDLCAYLLSL